MRVGSEKLEDGTNLFNSIRITQKVCLIITIVSPRIVDDWYIWYILKFCSFFWGRIWFKVASEDRRTEEWLDYKYRTIRLCYIDEQKGKTITEHRTPNKSHIDLIFAVYQNKKIQIPIMHINSWSDLLLVLVIITKRYYKWGA